MLLVLQIWHFVVLVVVRSKKQIHHTDISSCLMSNVM